MQVFVRQDVTNLYLRGLDKWVPTETDALTFPNRTSAFLFCIRYYLSGVRVVVKNDEGGWETDQGALPSSR